MSELGGNVTLSKEDLRDLISGAVTAAIRTANEPKPPTKAELEEIKQAQQMRLETAGSLNEQRKHQRWFQTQGCTHEHSKQAGGGTHCVHVKDNDHQDSAGYIICQNCQGRFRPDDDKWRKLDPDAIFSTHLFNKLFQDCAQAQGEMLG
jgi:hypothetical protein